MVAVPWRSRGVGSGVAVSGLAAFAHAGSWGCGRAPGRRQMPHIFHSPSSPVFSAKSTLSVPGATGLNASEKLASPDSGMVSLSPGSMPLAESRG